MTLFDCEVTVSCYVNDLNIASRIQLQRDIHYNRGKDCRYKILFCFGDVPLSRSIKYQIAKVLFSVYYKDIFVDPLIQTTNDFVCIDVLISPGIFNVATCVNMRHRNTPNEEEMYKKAICTTLEATLNNATDKFINEYLKYSKELDK